jgi:hypothetical protein
MVEVIVLSDDEGESNLPMPSTRPLERDMSCPNLPPSDMQKLKQPYKLVLVDSRRCPRMRRPRFLPIKSAQQSTGNLDENVATTTTADMRPAMDVDDEEEDPNYEDLRPRKRRRTGVKSMPKRHGRLIAPDWDIVRNEEAGFRQPDKRTILPAIAVSGRKGAREYVKTLTANVDWEGMLRHLGKMRLNEATGGSGIPLPEPTNGKPRRSRNPANRLKQYWQGVLTKSILKMDAD